MNATACDPLMRNLFAFDGTPWGDADLSGVPVEDLSEEVPPPELQIPSPAYHTYELFDR